MLIKTQYRMLNVMWCKGCLLRHNTECDVMWCKWCWLRHNAECDVM